MAESIEKILDLSTFQLTTILNNNSKTKSICVLGNFLPKIDGHDNKLTNQAHQQPQQAIVMLEKLAFTAADVFTGIGGGDSGENEKQVVAGDGTDSDDESRRYFSLHTKLKREFINDIYGNFQCFPKQEINSVKVTIIYPCTEKHIQKYSSQAIRIVRETPELFKTLTEPRLELEKEHLALDWVYNILDHKKESDRIIYEDPCKELGFILLPDIKWDGKTLETFYAIAIVHQLNLKSIRSLTAEHLPLLRNIRTKATDAINTQFNLDQSKLRIYFHYQPSFYHLHVHFTYLKYDAPGIFCEKSHLLDTVIDNIELMPDYYQKATLSFVIKESDAYCSKYLPKTVAVQNTNNESSDEPETKKPKLSN